MGFVDIDSLRDSLALAYGTATPILDTFCSTVYEIDITIPVDPFNIQRPALLFAGYSLINNPDASYVADPTVSLTFDYPIITNTPAVAYNAATFIRLDQLQTLNRMEGVANLAGTQINCLNNPTLIPATVVGISQASLQPFQTLV